MKPASLNGGLGSKFTGIVETRCWRTRSNWQGHNEGEDRPSCKGERTDSQQEVWAPGIISCEKKKPRRVHTIMSGFHGDEIYIVRGIECGRTSCWQLENLTCGENVHPNWGQEIFVAAEFAISVQDGASRNWVDRQVDWNRSNRDVNKLTRRKKCLLPYFLAQARAEWIKWLLSCSGVDWVC